LNGRLALEGKIICCLFFCFANYKIFAQQHHKDSLPGYNFRYYKLPGQPDSATYFKRMDSTMQQQKRFNELKRKIDSLQELTPQKKYLTYNKIKQ
jgi:hypothetical protein